MNCFSFSLYGKDPKYLTGAIQNTELASKWFPSYQCYFFIDKSVPDSTVKQLSEKSNVQLISMDHSPIPASMWRFTAIDLPEVDRMRCCDADSRLNERERAVMQSWEKDQTNFLVIKDHPYGHTGFPIFAGMWGMRKSAGINLSQLMEQWMANKTAEELRKYGADQLFLQEMVYPQTTGSLSYYDNFNLNNSDVAKNIPHQRKSWHFIGEVFDENNLRGKQWKTLRGYTLRQKGLPGYLASKVLNVFNPEWS